MHRCLVFALVGLLGCGPVGAPWVWQLPPGFPVPAVPDDNPMSIAKVELGRRLFYDQRLSLNQTQACASCHQQALAFADGRPTAVGSTGQAHRRNAQTLTNIAYASTLTWASPLQTSLERQTLLPLFGEHPVELGWVGKEDELFSRLAGDAALAKRFEAAFPGKGVTLETITRALACFERTLLSGQAPIDRFNAGDATALSADALAGRALFNGERLECYHCHTGFTLSDSVTHASTQVVEKPFHNTGLYDLDHQGSYPATDQGLYELTHKAGDMGRFRAPTLRNLRFTAPYMHDGSLATLAEVLDAYQAGGRAQQRTGRPSPLQSALVRPFSMTGDERRQVEAFLDALNDDVFTTDPALSDPGQE